MISLLPQQHTRTFTTKKSLGWVITLLVGIVLGGTFGLIGPTYAEGLTKEQGEAILQELKGIRQ